MYKQLKLLDDYNHLHAIPEKGYEEKQTKKYIMKRLENLLNIDLIYSGTYGLIYRYKNISENNFIKAFRAELDAVEINSVTNDFYHSCGHDSHMSILISFIEYVNQHRPAQNLLFIFQASEEKYGGSKGIVNELNKQKIKVESLYGLHVTPDLYPGLISCNHGRITAAIMNITYQIYLKESKHDSIHNNLILTIFFKIFNNIMQYKNGDRVQITNFFTDGSHNVQPQSLFFNLSIRAANNKKKEEIFQSIELNIKKICADKAYIKNEITTDYPSVFNDYNLYKKFSESFYKKGLFVKTPFIYSGDDISNYHAIANIPTLYIFIGCFSKNSKELHSNKFLVTESTMKTGLYVLLKILDT